MSRPRLAATWPRDGAIYVAREPDDADLDRHAPALAAWYGDPHNQAMITMNPGPISPERVREIHRGLQAKGGRTFLLFRDGELLGDADLRRIERDRAEFAIMVGQQGRGLGTAFSILLGEFAFRALGVRELYLSVIPENQAARRCYEKVGYLIDHGPAARSYADTDDDIAMVLTPDALRAAHGDSLDAISIVNLPP